MVKVLPFYLFTLLPLMTGCKDSFLEVTSPTDTFIEEY